MKFVYVDETGAKDQSDAFVMTGLLIDAYSLRICTVTFDDMIRKFLAGIVRRLNRRCEILVYLTVISIERWPSHS
jgi:hypothetical protein